MTAEVWLERDPAAAYLRTYREWLYIYGIDDPCIDELKAAIAVECARETHSIAQRDRLEILLRLIERDQRSEMECAA
jgi:hypothetical protein